MILNGFMVLTKQGIHSSLMTFLLIKPPSSYLLFDHLYLKSLEMERGVGDDSEKIQGSDLNHIKTLIEDASVLQYVAMLTVALTVH